MNLQLTPELIEKLDKVEPSPSERAAIVFRLLAERCSELTNQDLQCFAIEYLASQVATGELAFCEQEIKRLAKIYYLAHYYRVSCQAPLDSGLNLDITPKNIFVSKTKEDALPNAIPSPDSSETLT